MEKFIWNGDRYIDRCDIVDEFELLMEIREDVAAIRAYNESVEKRLVRSEARADSYDSRLRKVEIAILPISAGLGWIIVHLYALLTE